jgi:hypothetical protein
MDSALIEGEPKSGTYWVSCKKQWRCPRTTIIQSDKLERGMVKWDIHKFK